MRTADSIARHGATPAAPAAGDPRISAPTPGFWAAAFAASVFGATTAHVLLQRGDGFAFAIGAGATLVALALQLWSRRLVVPLNWLALSAVSVIATVAASVANDLGLPMTVLTIGYGSALAVWLAIWSVTHHSTDPRSVTNRAHEVFYWGATGLAFAMGTAVAHWLIFEARLGMLGAAAVLLGSGGFVAVLRSTHLLRPATTFWVRFVVVRALGMVVADWLTAQAPHAVALGFVPVLLASAAVGVTIMLVMWRRAVVTRTTGIGRMMTPAH